jgi:hypothetical protein
MKEGILACVTGLLFIAMMIGSMVFHTQTQYECTVAGMMAGFDASEIRAVCNIK